MIEVCCLTAVSASFYLVTGLVKGRFELWAQCQSEQEVFLSRISAFLCCHHQVCFCPGNMKDTWPSSSSSGTAALSKVLGNGHGSRRRGLWLWWKVWGVGGTFQYPGHASPTEGPQVFTPQIIRTYGTVVKFYTWVISEFTLWDIQEVRKTSSGTSGGLLHVNYAKHYSPLETII